MNDDRYVDDNWCPDCGLPRGVCDCSYSGDDHEHWDDWWDNPENAEDYTDYDDDGYEPPEPYGDM